MRFFLRDFKKTFEFSLLTAPGRSMKLKKKLFRFPGQPLKYKKF